MRMRRWLLVREVMMMASGEGGDDDLEFQEGDINRFVVNGTPTIDFSNRIQRILFKKVETTIILKLKYGHTKEIYPSKEQRSTKMKERMESALDKAEDGEEGVRYDPWMVVEKKFGEIQWSLQIGLRNLKEFGDKRVKDKIKKRKGLRKNLR
ncbi:hypothetical protein Gogos_015396, partial [Gossypium gossypioides]|nr:hypothetical protein [Gossypium gossypioides]